MNALVKLLALGAAVTLVGCKQEPPPSENNAEQVQPAKPAPAPEPAKPAPAPVIETGLSPDEPLTVVTGVPTPVDFADEAEKTVTPDNLEAELDRLEAEIGSE